MADGFGGSLAHCFVAVCSRCSTVSIHCGPDGLTAVFNQCVAIINEHACLGTIFEAEANSYNREKVLDMLAQLSACITGLENQPEYGSTSQNTLDIPPE